MTGTGTVTGTQGRQGEQGQELKRRGEQREGWRQKEPGDLQSDSRGGAEDAREGVMPMGNQQPQSKDPTPQRERCIMWRTRAQVREECDGTEG